MFTNLLTAWLKTLVQNFCPQLLLPSSASTSSPTSVCRWLCIIFVLSYTPPSYTILTSCSYKSSREGLTALNIRHIHMEMSGLQTLYARRQERCLKFALKCVKHQRNNSLFPLNEKSSKHYICEKELFQVNFARTEDYKKSAIPYCQRLLNDYCNGV